MNTIRQLIRIALCMISAFTVRMMELNDYANYNAIIRWAWESYWYWMDDDRFSKI